MSRATFETASLADAIRKATRFAPIKGAELDRAGGIVLDLEMPMETPVVTVRSTNLSVFYRQTIRPLRMEMDTTRWRASSVLLEAVLSKLPMQLGSTVDLEDRGESLHITAGKVRAKLNLYDVDAAYPEWPVFDPSGLELVEGFAQRVSQVRWACDSKAGNLLAGVHIDGSHLWATDRTCAVIVPLACPVDRPVTAPLADLVDLVKDHPEVSLRATEDALEVLVDEDTQVRVLLYAGAYPALGPFLNSPMESVAVLDKQALLAAIERLMVLDHTDRFPIMNMQIAENLITLRREVPDVGWIDEAIELREMLPPFDFWVNPITLRNMLQASAKSEIELAHGRGPLDPYSIRDGDGFVTVGLPRRVTS